MVIIGPFKVVECGCGEINVKGLEEELHEKGFMRLGATLEKEFQVSQLVWDNQIMSQPLEHLYFSVPQVVSIVRCSKVTCSQIKIEALEPR